MAVTVEFARRDAVPERHRWTCPKCGQGDDPETVKANLSVCPHCGHHLRIGARERIAQLADTGSFIERWSHLRTTRRESQGNNRQATTAGCLAAI